MNNDVSELRQGALAANHLAFALPWPAAPGSDHATPLAAALQCLARAKAQSASRRFLNLVQRRPRVTLAQNCPELLP